MKLPRSQHSNRPPRYPLGVMAAYGPDASLATKLVVSVMKRPGRHTPSATRTWTTVAVDVRQDPVIAASVAEFLRELRVKDTVQAERIIGCPHQEGIDYPLGRTCPQCPFWNGIDRFSHEPLVSPEPALSPGEILAALCAEGTILRAQAIESADGHREALVQPLLAALERGIADPAGASESEARLFGHALYLLAKWRETRAYPLVIRWLSLPEEQPFDIAGDIVAQDGGRILAAVCDGNLDPIVSLCINQQSDQWGRGAGVTALALLAAWAEVPRETVVARLTWLAREGLERKPSAVWDSLASNCANIEVLSLFPDLRRAYDDGLIDSMFMHRDEFDTVEAAPPGETLAATRDRYPPIDDVLHATSLWQWGSPTPREHELFDEDIDEQDDADFDEDRLEPPAAIATPYRAPAKVGRNEPCPCGSGKKSKKCCGK